MQADEVFLKIYTSSFRLVQEFAYDSKNESDQLAPGTHEVAWDGKDDAKRPLSSGTYFCFITVQVGKKKYETSGQVEIP